MRVRTTLIGLVALMLGACTGLDIDPSTIGGAEPMDLDGVELPDVEPPTGDIDAPDALVELVTTGSTHDLFATSEACHWIGSRTVDLHRQRATDRPMADTVRQVLAQDFGGDLGDVPERLTHRCGLAVDEQRDDVDLDRLAELFTPTDTDGYQPTAEQRADGLRSLSQHERAWMDRLDPHLDLVCPWVHQDAATRHALALRIVELRGDLPDRHDAFPAGAAVEQLCGVIG